MYLQKLIRTFHKEYPKKLTVTFLPLDSAPLIAKLTVSKQKHGHLSKGANMWVEK